MALSSIGFFNLGVKKMLVLMGPENVCLSGVGYSCSGKVHDLQIEKPSGQCAVSRITLWRPYEAKRIQCLARIRRWLENVCIRFFLQKLNGDLLSVWQATQLRRTFRCVTLALSFWKV